MVGSDKQTQGGWDLDSVKTKKKEGIERINDD